MLRMAVYTMELRDVLKQHNIFAFAYPFYDEKKRTEFEEAFKRHFYFREICCPNIDRFQIYLEDKFRTVFPYYNELMKTAQYEYDIENPYNLTETYTRNVDSMGKANGVSSVVDMMQRKETGKTDTESEANRNETQTGTGKDIQNDNGTSKTERSETVDNDTTRNASKTTETGSSGNKTSDQKYLDTPQGLTNLNDSKYLTNLTLNNEHHSENANGQESANERGTSDTKTDGESITTDEKRSTVERETQNDVTGKETQTGKTTAETEGEQRSTQDSNTRSENIGKQTETYTMTRKGNIGVNPASNEVDHHIITQKTLKRIEEMFFNECEDLFMLVY